MSDANLYPGWIPRILAPDSEGRGDWCVCVHPTWAKGHGRTPMAIELAGAGGLALQLPATRAAVSHCGAKGEFVSA